MKFSSISFHNLEVISIRCAGTCYRPAHYASCSWALDTPVPVPGVAKKRTCCVNQQTGAHFTNAPPSITRTRASLAALGLPAEEAVRIKSTSQYVSLLSSTPAVAPLHANACCFTLFRRSRQRSRYPRSTHAVHASAPVRQNVRRIRPPPTPAPGQRRSWTGPLSRPFQRPLNQEAPPPGH